MNKTYIGDTGTLIVLDCGQNISSASARVIEVQKPDLSTTTWTATASGTNAIQFTTVGGTLDQAGVWKLQAKVTIGANAWRGETARLRVYAQFEG